MATTSTTTTNFKLENDTDDQLAREHLRNAFVSITSLVERHATLFRELSNCYHQLSQVYVFEKNYNLNLPAHKKIQLDKSLHILKNLVSDFKLVSEDLRQLFTFVRCLGWSSIVNSEENFHGKN